MDAQVFILPLLSHFANLFTRPGFAHFKYFILGSAKDGALGHTPLRD